MTTTPTAPLTLDAAPGVESCVAALVHALQQEKGWLHGYADSILRDAIDRVHLDAAPEIAAIREALAAFPKGWQTVFEQVRELEPGVVEIGALWEDSDDLAEVVTIDTGNYYDNAAAMPMAKFIAACNPTAMTAVLATIAKLEARLREASNLLKRTPRVNMDTYNHGDRTSFGFQAKEMVKAIDAAIAAHGKDGAHD